MCSRWCLRLPVIAGLGQQPQHRAAPRLSGTSCSSGSGCPQRSGGWNLGVSATELSPTSTNPCPAPEPPAWGEPAHARPGEKGPLGTPAPPFLQMAGAPFLLIQEWGGSSSLQPLPPAPPPPVKPPARTAPSSHSTCGCPSRASSSVTPEVPSPLLCNTQLCPGALGTLGALSLSAWEAQVLGREAAPAPCSPWPPRTPQALVSGSVMVSAHHPGLGATPHLACHSSPLHPSTSKISPEGTQISAQWLPAT